VTDLVVVHIVFWLHTQVSAMHAVHALGIVVWDVEII